MAGSDLYINTLYIVILTKMQKMEDPENEICLSDIWKHKLFKIILSFDLL